MHTYSDLKDTLAFYNVDSLPTKGAANRWVYIEKRSETAIAICYYEFDILTFTHETVCLRDGGCSKGKRAKDHINVFIPYPYYLHQKKFQMLITDWQRQIEIPYFDGITLPYKDDYNNDR